MKTPETYAELRAILWMSCKQKAPISRGLARYMFVYLKYN